jgi:uncharacterized protein (TIGR02300 family)
VPGAKSICRREQSRFRSADRTAKSIAAKGRGRWTSASGFDSGDSLWQGPAFAGERFRFFQNLLEHLAAMVKPEWGTKRTCPKCATRFYDLSKDDPVTCINCGNIWVPEPILKSKQPLPFDEAPKKDAVDEDAEKSPDDEVDLGGDDDLGVDTGTGEDEV